MINRCSAGVRNSALTNHGVQQAARLGTFFAAAGVLFTHIFSSDLDRAVKTAEAVRDAQTGLSGRGEHALQIVKESLLQEQDFGSLEGVSFRTMPPMNANSGTASTFKEVETKESMARRADAFLDAYLGPTVAVVDRHNPLIIAIVSHGMFLSTLWKRLLRRMPNKSVSFAAELPRPDQPISLEHLGGWANTGFLQLRLQLALPNHEQAPETVSTEASPQANNSSTPHSEYFPWSLCKMFVIAVNSKEHLNGLKRAKGGIGSAKFDEKQSSIKSFFK